MKPIEQTRTWQGAGNCFAACVASILECRLEEVPDPGNDEKMLDYMDRVQAWLCRHNMMLICTGFTRWTTESRLPYPGPAILTCDSPRGGTHAVVWQNGEVIWDPHPQREQGIGEKREIMFFVPTHPDWNAYWDVCAVVEYADANMAQLDLQDTAYVRAYIVGAGVWNKALGVARGSQLAPGERARLWDETRRLLKQKGKDPDMQTLEGVEVP